MTKRKTTIYIDEELLRAAKVMAARQDLRDSEVMEAALRRYLGLGLLRGIARRSGLSEEEALKMAYEELHAEHTAR